MREVLLTDVALWGALIMAAALIIIRRWRSNQSRAPARGRRGDAAELTGRKMPPPRTATGLNEDSRQPDRAAPGPARPAPVEPPRAREMADPKARPYRPGLQCNGQHPAGPATPSEQIASYYDQADQPIADYLAALGWTQRPHTLLRRAAGGDAGSAAGPRDGTVSS